MIAALMAAIIANTSNAVSIRQETAAPAEPAAAAAEPVAAAAEPVATAPAEKASTAAPAAPGHSAGKAKVAEEDLLDEQFYPDALDIDEETERPQSCMHGKFWSGEERGCVTCATGHYCPEGTLDYQFPCPSGTYNDLTGQWLCQICPTGHFCPHTSSEPTACPPGKFNDILGMDRCIPCPVGHECPSEAMEVPSPCAAGQW
jgi:hypothetical protein